jgi:TonB family protein
MTTKLVIGFMFLSCACVAQTVSTAGKPLDKMQVLALLANGVPNSRVATVVIERGITFEPTVGYAELLQKAGGDEGVVAATRTAQRLPARPEPKSASSGNRPLERDQILDLLQTGVNSNALAKLVATRGIDFEPFDDYLHAYEIAGAQDSLLTALRQAGQSMPEATTAINVAPKSDADKGVGKSPGTKRIRIPGEIAAAKLTFQPKPEYPQLAKMARIQGTVRLQGLIGQDGSIEELRVLSGHPLLVKSAMDAVSRWQYRPTLLNGKPIEVVTEIDLSYVLQQ